MLFILNEIIKGKSLARALFNAELAAVKVNGLVLDVGGGKHQDYLGFLDMDGGVSVETVDIALKGQRGRVVDFEKDPLPFNEAVFDHVLVFNVLEHVYNYQFLIKEMQRVLREGGQLVGFVPFLVNYHPDPHDYFRYTKEALRKILESNGFDGVRVSEVGRGPFAVNYNNLALSLPIAARVVLLPLYYFADTLFLSLRPNIRARYPLGYLFTAQK